MRRFENAKSAKFWSYSVDGSTLTLISGRVGGDGHTKTKKFGSAADALSGSERLIEQRLKQGFEEVDPASAEPAVRKTRGAARRKVKKKAAKKKAVRRARPRSGADLSVVCPPTSGRGLVLGAGSDGIRAIAVGGQGRDLVLLTDDGVNFHSTDTGGGGLRGACVHGDEMWVAGEYGFVAKSLDAGATWTKIESGSGSCLFAVLRDSNGSIWTAGDNGFLAVCVDGQTFKKVEGVDEYIGRITDSPLGILIPTDGPKGHLFTCKRGNIERTAVEAGVDLMQATVSPLGTLMVVGAQGHVHRSVDEGASFDKIEVRAGGLLTGVKCFADGRVIIVGAAGTILVSSDDGESFSSVPHEHGGGTFWFVHPHGDSMLIGGESGLVLRLGNAPRVPDTSGNHEVVLMNAGPKVIQMIKLIREATGLGLKESKDIADEAPSRVKAGLSREAAEALAARIREIGGEAQVD